MVIGNSVLLGAVIPLRYFFCCCFRRVSLCGVARMMGFYPLVERIWYLSFQVHFITNITLVRICMCNRVPFYFYFVCLMLKYSGCM